jgi:hypothetical protein
MKFKIEINIKRTTVETAADIADTLMRIAARVRESKPNKLEIGTVLDASGEEVGFWRFQKHLLRSCEECGGPGPTLMDPFSRSMSCRSCHSLPNDIFFREQDRARETIRAIAADLLTEDESETDHG